METGKGRRLPSAQISAVFYFLLPAFFLAGCGAPGEPTPPASQIPTAISDLSAQQAGEAVQLRFTPPSKTVRGEPLNDTPAVEILRGALKPNGSPDPRSFRVVQTIPGALVENYRAEDRLEFADSVSAEELRNYPERTLAYRVRTRASRRRPSADSNMVIVHWVPVAARITDLRAAPTETAIELTWSAPTQTSDGGLLQAVSEYRVYRGELDPSSAEDAAKDLSQAKWIARLTLLGRSETNQYRDTSFEFGKTYAYTVRSLTTHDGTPIESSDSVPAIATPRDVYPPSAPQGVIAATIVGETTKSAEVDLSWSMNAETDLAGYRVYRSEQQETPGQLMTPDVLLSPAYRDTSVAANHRYWYTVTAVDRAGNESAPSAPVAADVTQPSS
jgi:hypothetical protein